MKLLRILFSFFIAGSLYGQWSPTEEYFKHEDREKVFAEIEKGLCFFHTDYKELLYELAFLIDNQLIPREKLHGDDYVVFYHGQHRGFFIYYEFQRRLREALHQKHKENVVCLRNSFYEGSLIDDFLEKNHKEKIKEWDHQSGIQKSLLSVSVSFPGRRPIQLESASDFFLLSPYLRAANSPGKEIFCEIINNFFKDSSINYESVKESLLNELGEMFEELENDYTLQWGLLLQIFVPKNLIEHYAYFSQQFGKPGTAYSYPWYLLFQASGEGFISAQKIQEALEQGKGNRLQARLLLHDDLFNPAHSPVIMYSYHKIPKAVTDYYKIRIQRIVDEIVDILVAKDAPSFLGNE